MNCYPYLGYKEVCEQIPVQFPPQHQPIQSGLETIPTFGSDTPMKRAGQPFEPAPTHVYLASEDSSYVTGQVLHVDGGQSMQS